MSEATVRLMTPIEQLVEAVARATRIAVGRIRRCRSLISHPSPASD